MNVAFHSIGAIATAAVLSNLNKTSESLKFGVGFVVGILIHGILDFLPHQYPFPSKVDVFIALFIVLLAAIIARKQQIFLILVCFIGSLFPDMIDLSPAIANKHFGLNLPEFPSKIFPWHWKEYSGSIYDGSKFYESVTIQILFVSVCFLVLYLSRKNFLKI